jgi:molecular chaperone HscB
MKIDDDHFTLFGLPPRFAIEREAIDARWRALQAEVHPDRFAAEGAAAQRLAMQWAVRVNEAHRTPKDPLQRGAYLCELRGVPVAAESNTAMPAAFLMQQMAWREALDEARSATEVDALAAEVAQEEADLLRRLQSLLDDPADPANPGDGDRTPAAAQTVRSLMFVVRFRQDIERRLDALDPHR